MSDSRELKKPSAHALSSEAPNLGGHKSGKKNNLPHQKSEKGRRDAFSRILLIAGSLLIVAALAVAGYLIWRNHSVNTTYDNVASIAGMSNPSQITADNPIDWAALQAINPDIIGWLYLPGTGLNYPIVQGPDNDFYLTHLFDNTPNSAGAIFLDYENSRNLEDPVNFIYGHNMLGNFMFSEITNYVDPAFMAANPQIIIFTPDRTITLDVIAAIRCKGSDPVRSISFDSTADFDTYKQSLDAYVVAGDTTALNKTSNLFIFSTCKTFDMNSRIMMIATDNSKNTGSDKTTDQTTDTATSDATNADVSSASTGLTATDATSSGASDNSTSSPASNTSSGTGK